MGQAIATRPAHGARRPNRAVVLVHVLALASAGAIVVVTARSARWDAWPFLLIAAFTVASGVAYVESGSSKLKVSGTLLGLVLAGVVLGAGPAALIGATTTVLRWLRSREAPHYLRNNLVTFTWFPLIGALFFHAVVQLMRVGTDAVGYYAAVFPTFLVALAINFLGVVGYQCYLDGSSLVQKAREVLAPVMAAELFSAILTLVAVFFTAKTGTIGLALLGLMLVIYQYLVAELLKSKQRAEELHRLATTDELTGLANRQRFQAVIQERIAAARASNESFAVMLLDLDRFKEVNDTLGHHYGDELLREIGPRLGARVGPGGLVARLGGDEFGVLPGGGAEDAELLERVAARLLAGVTEPVAMEGMMLEVGASIGISRFPLDGEDAHALLRRADVAMYAAKESHSGCTLYASGLDRHSVRRLSVLSDVRRALESDQIVVHYQPIVDVSGSRVRGAEGLVRWEHPRLGLIPPGDFIPILEQSGLIGALTRHVLERAIAQCAAWRHGGQELSVAVNLSVRDLLDRTLPAEIERLLSAYRLPAGALQLEITERMLMSDPDRALATLMRLSELGIVLSVDDFGTGYSSLANLRRLPINELKIDRSFVSPMLLDISDLIIVRSTINLGHDLGLTVIAEGVEDEATLRRLAVLSCDLAQGYHVSRPMAPEAFSRWLEPGPLPALPVGSAASGQFAVAPPTSGRS